MTYRIRFLSLLPLLALCAGADWPQFLGPQRNGVSAETGLVLSWDSKGPPVLWEREVGEGYSAPVVAGDRLILFHRLANEDVVECLDPATGKPRWKYTYPTSYQDWLNKGNGPRSTPLIAEGKVFTLGAAGHLLCLDLATGKKSWSRNLLDDYQVRRSFFGIGTSPILEGDILAINVGGREGAGIVGFHKDTGKEVWRATDHDASYASPVAATFDGVRHLIFFTREGLVSLDPASGAVRFNRRWRPRINESVNAASPVVAGDQVFVSTSYNTGALVVRGSKQGVEEIWKGDDSLSCHFSTPVERAGFLYGFDGRQEVGTQFRCVEWKTGKVRWGQEGFGCGSLITVQGLLLVLSEDGDLVVVEPNPDRYVEKCRAKVLTGPVRAHLALADGRLFARDNRKLICFRLKKE
jgi:outer membrane protein assembly factor BamB